MPLQRRGLLQGRPTKQTAPADYETFGDARRASLFGNLLRAPVPVKKFQPQDHTPIPAPEAPLPMFLDLTDQPLLGSAQMRWDLDQDGVLSDEEVKTGSVQDNRIFLSERSRLGLTQKLASAAANLAKQEDRYANWQAETSTLADMKRGISQYVDEGGLIDITAKPVADPNFLVQATQSHRHQLENAKAFGLLQEEGDVAPAGTPVTVPKASSGLSPLVIGGALLGAILLLRRKGS